LFIQSVSNLMIKKVISANRLLNSPVGITIHRYNRENWAIILKVTGKTVYTVGNKTIISDSQHPVILPKGCTYSWKCIEPGECITIDFDADETQNTFDSFEIKDNTTIINAFSKIEKNLSIKKSNYKLECSYHLHEILLFLLKSINKEQPHKKTNSLLKPAIKYITEHYYDSNITNDSLAELCGISTVYFRKTFENVYGISPIKYLHNFRIKKAKSILRSDYDTIEQVAFSVGYNSIYNFSKMFKLYTELSPSQYAKSLKKQH